MVLLLCYVCLQSVNLTHFSIICFHILFHSSILCAIFVRGGSVNLTLSFLVLGERLPGELLDFDVLDESQLSVPPPEVFEVFGVQEVGELKSRPFEVTLLTLLDETDIFSSGKRSFLRLNFWTFIGNKNHLQFSEKKCFGLAHLEKVP